MIKTYFFLFQSYLNLYMLLVYQFIVRANNELDGKDIHTTSVEPRSGDCAVHRFTLSVLMKAFLLYQMSLYIYLSIFVYYYHFFLSGVDNWNVFRINNLVLAMMFFFFFFYCSIEMFKMISTELMIPIKAIMKTKKTKKTKKYFVGIFSNWMFKKYHLFWFFHVGLIFHSIQYHHHHLYTHIMS